MPRVVTLALRRAEGHRTPSRGTGSTSRGGIEPADGARVPHRGVASNLLTARGFHIARRHRTFELRDRLLSRGGIDPADGARVSYSETQLQLAHTFCYTRFGDAPALDLTRPHVLLHPFWRRATVAELMPTAVAFFTHTHFYLLLRRLRRPTFDA